MKIISIDVESNGLFGEGFAVGAVVFDMAALAVVGEFAGRAPVQGDWNEWVQQNVRPAVKHLRRYENTALLRLAFWKWYKGQQDAAVFTVADVGYPVETGFLRACQVEADDWFGGPYPLHDVATLILAAGIDAHIGREDYVRHLLPAGRVFTAHNPLDDATVSAFAAVQALRGEAQVQVEPAKVGRKRKALATPQ